MSGRPVSDVASKEKNEYIPSFITKKPFWVPDDEGTSANDYLEHQRLHSKDSAEHAKWYDRGKRLGPAATKFRKGACENCGALTHKTKECLSRPRKSGAKWTGKDIQADEAVQDVKLGWDAKRDRWNGYDAADYRNVVNEYEELERLRKKSKALDQDDSVPAEARLVSGVENQEEEARYAEESDMGRQQSTATRNLRLREDTAKYLLNLDLDSAKYDPKTRAMVDMGAQTDQAAALVAEDNFMRASGDAAEFERAQRYAWESQERGDKHKQHIQANPTSGEYLRRKEAQKSAAKRQMHKQMLLEKYGGEQHLSLVPRQTVKVIENERFVEYDDFGAIKGAPRVDVQSKYPENILNNNHTTVWGSWWKDFQWGYACCHSTTKNSYCTGAVGKQAFDDVNLLKMDESLLPEIDSADKSSSVTMIKGIIDLQKSNEADADTRARKRKAAEVYNGVTEEELEAYKCARRQAEDPMANHLGKDELIT